MTRIFTVYFLVLVALLINITGCASFQTPKLAWKHKSGFIQESFNIDLYVCQKESYTARVGYFRMVDANAAQNQATVNCMYTKGYQLTEVE